MKSLYFSRIEELRNRKVGEETSRTYVDKILNGFWDKYASGHGCDIGYSGYIGALPLFPETIGVNLDYPGYDGKVLPFGNESQDYVYNSHVLEHILDTEQAVKEWFRVLKVNGYLIIAVPHQWLYEKKKSLPSRYNADHKHFFTPASLLNLMEKSLEPNSYRIRLLEDGDKNFDYSIVPTSHSSGQLEILLVLQKIKMPTWKIE